MKLPDLNLLLYAVDEASPRHAKACNWLEAGLSGTESVAFAWVVLLGFLRISTSPAVFEQPLTAREAFDYVEEWLAQPVAVLIAPAEAHLELLRKLLDPLGVAGNLFTDAHLAALAIENGAELCSSDTDFARFGVGLRWSDPLR